MVKTYNQDWEAQANMLENITESNLLSEGSYKMVCGRMYDGKILEKYPQETKLAEVIAGDIQQKFPEYNNILIKPNGLEFFGKDVNGMATGMKVVNLNENQEEQTLSSYIWFEDSAKTNPFGRAILAEGGVSANLDWKVEEVGLKRMCEYMNARTVKINEEEVEKAWRENNR